MTKCRNITLKKKKKKYIYWKCIVFFTEMKGEQKQLSLDKYMKSWQEKLNKIT